MFEVIWEGKRVIPFTLTLLVADDELELVLVPVELVDNSEAMLAGVWVFFLKGMRSEYLQKKCSLENKCWVTQWLVKICKSWNSKGFENSRALNATSEDWTWRVIWIIVNVSVVHLLLGSIYVTKLSHECMSNSEMQIAWNRICSTRITET